MNLKSRCIGTPKAVISELRRLDMITTGNRNIDIPKYWKAMSNIKATPGSPAAQYEQAKQIWRKNKDEL